MTFKKFPQFILLSHQENNKYKWLPRCIWDGQQSNQWLKQPYLTTKIFSFLNQTHNLINAITDLTAGLQILYLNPVEPRASGKLSIWPCFGLVKGIKAIFLFSFYAGSSLSLSLSLSVDRAVQEHVRMRLQSVCAKQNQMAGLSFPLFFSFLWHAFAMPVLEVWFARKGGTQMFGREVYVLINIWAIHHINTDILAGKYHTHRWVWACLLTLQVHS